MDKIKAWYVILRHQREVKGWSQKQVARALNTDEKRVSLWECGTSKPDLRNRKKLAKLYNKSLEELGFIVEKAETSDTPCAKPPVPSFAQQETHSIQNSGVGMSALKAEVPSPNEAPLQITIHIHPQASIVTSTDDREHGIIEERRITLGQENPSETEDIVNRRDALRQLTAIGFTLVTMPRELMDPQSWSQLSDAAMKPACIDPETLGHFEDLIKTCWHLSKSGELEVAEHTLWGYLPRIVTLAKQTSEYQPGAAEVASQGYLLAASLAGHRNDLKARQSLSEHALLYGVLANNRNMQISALRQLALTFDYMERPGKALEAYQQALPYLNQASPLLSSRMYAGLAGAYAQREQMQEALHFLGMAHECFPEIPEDDPSYLHADSDLFTLILWDGLTHLDLNQPNAAWKAFTRIDGLHPKVEKLPEKVRIEFLNYQAETLIALGELEQGCAYLEEAVKASLAIGSERRYSESFNVYKKMRMVWRDEPKVKVLGGIFIR